MRAFIWPWLVLSSAGVIIFFAQKSLNLKIALCYFKIKRKTVKQRWSRWHKVRYQGQGHKKIQGLGPTFRWQTLLRQRTGMLKVKDSAYNVQEKGFSRQKIANFREISGILKAKDVKMCPQGLHHMLLRTPKKYWVLSIVIWAVWLTLLDDFDNFLRPLNFESKLP